MPKSIPYTLFAPLSLAVRYTPARLELIAAVGPPDCPTITFPFMMKYLRSVCLPAGCCCGRIYNYFSA